MDLSGKAMTRSKRSALINDIDNGGLSMMDIQSMISSQIIITVEKYCDDCIRLWKSILDTFLGRNWSPIFKKYFVFILRFY